jgi:hypothetical protein
MVPIIVAVILAFKCTLFLINLSITWGFIPYLAITLRNYYSSYMPISSDTDGGRQSQEIQRALKGLFYLL